jgi:hypothetical protein
LMIVTFERLHINANDTRDVFATRADASHHGDLALGLFVWSMRAWHCLTFTIKYL